MALAEKRMEAELLYIRKSMSCPAIATELKLNEGTVYRWKSEAEAKGEAFDWDVQRRIYTMSPLELTAIYAETLKSWFVKLKENPELLADPKIADAVSKHVSVMKRIDGRSQYLGVVNDLIRVTNTWLAENQPELKTRLDPHWDSIYQELVSYFKKGVFEG